MPAQRARTNPPGSTAPSSPPLHADRPPTHFPRGTEPQQPLREPAQHIHAELRALESSLARSLAALEMHYQPIVTAATRDRFGYEALLRSTDPALPHVGAILGAAERLERVTLLGRAVRAQVARQVAEMPAERGVVFVNLHVFDLLDKQLTSAFAPLTKVAPRIVLEITERTALCDHADELRDRIAELRALGFRIAIDDVGGAVARVCLLSPGDTDFVKLDMSLVRGIDRQPIKQRLVRALAEQCHARGIRLVGEGVETEAEAKTLAELGCDLLQGYVIARPAPAFADPL